MDIQINIKLSDDTAEMNKTFHSFEEARDYILYMGNVVAIAGNNKERAYELINA